MSRWIGRPNLVLYFTTGKPCEWDAVASDALPLPHERWVRRLLGTLPLRGDERVRDVGAGSGSDTVELLGKLPQGHVVAVDGSAVMLNRLRERLSMVGAERLSVRLADLHEPLVLAEPVDAVFSVAALHCLPDHAAVFASLAGVLRPGGLLRAEWGGRGNLTVVNAVLAELGRVTVNDSLGFADAEQTAQHLADADFGDVRVGLLVDPVRLKPGVQPKAFLSTVVLHTVLDPLPPDQRPAVVREVADRLPEPVIGYVRLQAAAHLPVPQRCP